jgi:hypothetical protein
MNVVKKEDIIDVYSFGLFLNIHTQLTNHTFKNNGIFNGIFYLIIYNLLMGMVLRYSSVQVLTHKFWRKNLHSVAMPLTMNSISNVLALQIQLPDLFINRHILEFIMLISSNYFINMHYPNEMECSKIFRFNITLFYFSLMMFF